MSKDVRSKDVVDLIASTKSKNKGERDAAKREIERRKSMVEADE